MVRRITKNNPAKPMYPDNHDLVVYKALRQEVMDVVRRLEPVRRREVLLKAFLFPLLYIGVYALLLVYGRNPVIYYGACLLMGILLVIVFLNIVHDAVHNAIFRRKWANRLFIHFFDLMGANSFMWQARHVRFHHHYPNVQDWDTDIEQSTLFRVFPGSPFLGMHRFQHIYLPLLYPFYLANWLLVRDFKDFFNKRRTVHKLIMIPRIEFVKLFLFKFIFLFYTIVLPKFLLDISWLQAVAGFAIFLFSASIFSLMILLTPHANTESSFPLPDAAHKMPESWMRHMMLTTNDITHDNFITRFFMGCFNYHVVHHLFPQVNHVYYPEITAVLKRFAATYGLPYREYTLAQSLRNHYLLLKQNRIEENIFEESM